MQNQPHIAIGALGGSGTRAVAKIFIDLGVHMMEKPNEPKDNLLFARLFKDPKWFKKASPDQVSDRLSLFQKSMSGSGLTTLEWLKILYAAFQNNTHKTYNGYYLTSRRLLKNSANRPLWGWKEPNTQFYLDEIFAFFPSLKYIHVVRHGLDMAYSRNLQQLKNWGWLYEISLKDGDSEDEVARKQLAYWVAATKDVLATLQLHPERSLVLNHTNFCNEPVESVDELLAFSDFEPSSELRQQLYAIPSNTGSNNRFRGKDLSIFPEEDLAFIREMGFEF